MNLEGMSYMGRYIEFGTNPMILYSGGLDSTVLVDMVLSFLKKQERVRNNKVSIYTIHTNLIAHEQQEHERLKISKFEEYCKETYKGHVDYQFFKTVFNTTISPGRGNKYFEGKPIPDGIALPQQLLLLSTIALNACHMDMTLLVGYVNEDHFCKKTESFTEYIHCIEKLTDSKIHFYTPFLYIDKYWIYGYAKEHNLLDYIYYCEHPKSDGSPCGRCTSCIHHYAAEKTWEYHKFLEKEEMEKLKKRGGNEQ